MNLQTISEHTIDTDLLTDGIVIDAGCRGFGFSTALRDLGCQVWAFDLEEFATPEDIMYFKSPLLESTRYVDYVNTKDLQAKYISGNGNMIMGFGINHIYERFEPTGINVDVLKLDIEGSEYLILSDENFQPTPRQITVEFHEHAHKALHEQYFDKCMENLLKHYVPVQHERTAQHGAGFNYWDSLFVRKDLIL